MALAPPCPFCEKLTRLHELPDEDVVWQLPHSVVFLGPWQFYDGYCLIVARQHATELSQLGHAERCAFLDEMCLVARAIEQSLHPHKLNYELLGNQVPHLHWHVFPRSAADSDAQKPVWLALERADHDPAERRRLQAGPRGRAETTALLRRKLQALSPVSL
jgi:diadenosine tetraphosphate (Ap4A) HIT family hydrolase